MENEKNQSLTRYIVLTVICYIIWGFQPLYFNLYDGVDSIFLLMSRIFWGCSFMLVIILVQRRGREVLEALRDRELMWKHLIPAAFFNFMDLALYIWAAMNGHLMDTSLGYYVAPLVVCVLGILVFHEKATWQLGVAALMILVGIYVSGSGFGSSPLISVALMFCCSLYAAFMRGVKTDSVICTTVLMLLMLPVALITLFGTNLGKTGLASITPSMLVFLIMAGVIMVVPIILYASALKRVPFVIMGFFQYLSPTLGLLTSYILGERMAEGQIWLFMGIWGGILVYTIATALQARKTKA